MKQYNCPDCCVLQDTCDGCQRATSIPSNKIESPITDWWLKKDLWSDIPSCCRGCSNHPSNGGSGICHCTLPYMHGYGVTYSSGEYKILTTDDINGNIITTVVRSGIDDTL